MLFTSPVFTLFFLVVFSVYWLLPSHRGRKLLLLVASYAFYAAWDYRFLLLIAASTLVDYVAALAMERKSLSAYRRFFLVVSLCANLGILGFFKYFDFFVTNAMSVLRLAGIDTPIYTLDIVLPVGISFFTFQSMSYTIDVYRGVLKARRGFTDFALYVSFFPQLVAGPIVRAREFLPQLEMKRALGSVNFKAASLLFLIGFFKKTVVSDNLAIWVDRVFEDPASYNVLATWSAVAGYAVQIYADFSGYTDMAIALAAMLGFTLCPNFAHPYLAGNIQEYWRRWHMSLSGWLRDYLYISLGGNRGTVLQMYRNIMITMLLGGLWHGASWNFVIWGGLHGVALCLHRVYRAGGEAFHWSRPVLARLGWPMTFWFTCVTWIFFRATSFDSSIRILQTCVFFSADGDGTAPRKVLLALPILLMLHVAAYHRSPTVAVQRVPWWLYAPLFGIVVGLILFFVPLEYKPFIYFQF